MSRIKLQQLEQGTFLTLILTPEKIFYQQKQSKRIIQTFFTQEPKSFIILQGLNLLAITINDS